MIKIIFISIFLFNISTSFASCVPDKIDDLRQSALKSYKAKDIVSAEKTLTQYYRNECSFYNMIKSSDAILNKGLWLISDLMFYHQKQGKQLQCLALDNEVYNTWMLSETWRYDERVNKALKANYNQCKKTIDSAYLKAKKCPITGYEHMLALPESWKDQDDRYYEIPCLSYVENSESPALQRDGPKTTSEALNIARLDILYIENLNQDAPTYKLDRLYFANEDASLFGEMTCHTFTPYFGKKSGSIYFDGSSSSSCGQGSGSQITRLIVNLDFPFKAQIVDSTSITVK